MLFKNSRARAPQASSRAMAYNPSEKGKTGAPVLSRKAINNGNAPFKAGEPAPPHALTYSRTTDMPVAPVQQRHFPGKAWQMVQQKREEPTPALQRKAFQPTGGIQRQALKKDNGTGPLVVQRNDESTQVLSTMVEPKVGQQVIDLAKEIETELDRIYKEDINIDDINTPVAVTANYNSAVCLGGIVLPPLQGYTGLDDLIDQCRFVNLGKGSVGRGIYELLGEGIKNNLIRNTLTTMHEASQLDYLRESDFASQFGSAWKVVIEVHYYRKRLTQGNQFHKDTLGNTLFVNLNYLNKERIAGPEYVVNPAENETHMEKIRQSLPKEFLLDRRKVMNNLGVPESMQITAIPEYGYVSFVDEMINHSSPTTEHRRVYGKDIHDHLKKESKDQYDKYAKRYEQWSGMPKDKPKKMKVWHKIFEEIENNSITRYNRRDIRNFDPKYQVFSDDSLNQLIHTGSHHNFGEVSIPNPPNNSLQSDMTYDDRPLKRQMSMILEENQDFPLEKEVDEKRSFLRTWVRAEKMGKVVTDPEWKWDQTE